MECRSPVERCETQPRQREGRRRQPAKGRGREISTADVGSRYWRGLRFRGNARTEKLREPLSDDAVSLGSPEVALRGGVIALTSQPLCRINVSQETLLLEPSHLRGDLGKAFQLPVH